MKIKLNKSFFWFLPSGKAHLSEENPGPIELQFDNLTIEEQNIIQNSMRSGQISILDDMPVNKNIVTAPAPLPVQVVPTVQKVVSTLEPTLQTLLNKPVSTITRELGALDDLRQLRLMIEWERAGKARKSVISLLQNRIDHLSKAVIETSNKIKSNVPLSPIDPLMDQFNITDSEVTTVEIKRDVN